MRTARRMLKQVRRALLLAFVFSGFVNVLMLATPLYTLQVFETVVPLGSIETLLILTAITAASVLALALIEIARDLILARAGVWADHTLGQFMLENGLRAGLPAHQMRHDLRALDTLRGFISGPAVTPFFDGPWVPIFLVALTVLHPMLGLLGLVSAGLLFTASLLQAAATDRLQRESAQARERAAQWWSLATGNPPLSGALGLAGGVSDAWEVANRGHVAGAYSLAKRASVVKALARSVRIGSQIAVYAIGAWLVVNDQVTPGVLVASAILLARALAPLEQLVGAIKPAIAAWRAYRTLKDLPDDVRQAPLDDEDGLPPMQIALQDVTVYLPGRKTPALRGVNIEISPGQSLGLVGPNGSGKSTLAGVIAGAIVPAAGSADLAGVAISRWQRGSDRPLIGYLPDEPLLVDGTVQQNIVRFTDASLMAAAAAAMKVGVHERLQSLPMGYECEVGPAGQALSLSERRAVAMARAVCGGPAVIVLDEPEAGLDGTGIRQLMRALQELKAAGTTLVLATQDPRLLRVVDRVAVLSSGSIAKITTPGDMLRGNAPATLTPRNVAANERPACEPRADAAAGGAA